MDGMLKETGGQFEVTEQRVSRLIQGRRPWMRLLGT